MATLEEFAAKAVAPDGDMTPDKQQYAVQTAQQLRERNPGRSDDDIIGMITGMPEMAGTGANPNGNASPAPVAASPTAGATTPPVAGGRAAQYAASNAELKEKFSPEKEQAARDESRRRSRGAEWGQDLSVGLQVAGGDKNALERYNKQQTEIANRPSADFAAQKAAYQQQLEADLRTGDIEAQDARNSLAKYSLQWALKDRATKDTYEKAKQDPNSATSNSMRQQFKMLSPDMYAQIPNVDKMSAAQISQFLPTVEKAYLKNLEIAGKKATAETLANGKTEAARIKADAKGSGGVDPKVVISGARAENTIDKTVEADKANLAGVKRTQTLVNEAEGLLPKLTFQGGVIGGALQAAPTMAQSKERQRLNQIQLDLANQISMLAKGVQTDKDLERYKGIVDMLKQDDPTPGIKAAKEVLKEQEDRFTSSIAEGEDRKSRVQVATGAKPAVAASPMGKPITREEFLKLNKGDTFIGPDGNRWTK